MEKKLIIISPYPKAGKYTDTFSALSSFSKNLVDELKNQFDIVILSDNENKNDQAIKAWRKNDYLNYLNLIKTIFGYRNIQDILIQFEWGVFGKSLAFIIFFPAFLLILKLLGKKSYVVFHGVNFDFKTIFGSGLKTKLFNLGSYIFYSLSCLMAKKIVVTENYFKNQLLKLPFSKDKVSFIPHGVDITLIKDPNKSQSKMKLGYFGFLHPYKGPKILLNLFKSIDRTKFSLDFFGGASFSLGKDRAYQKFLKDFYIQAEKSKIKISGFIKEKDFNNYFGQVDLVVFPYSSFISSSGMLAMTFSFEKPFVISHPMMGYFDSFDFIEALQETKLKREDFVFDFNQSNFKNRLNWAKNNLNKLADFSRIMKEKRSWAKVAKQYEKLF